MGFASSNNSTSSPMKRVRSSKTVKTLISNNGFFYKNDGIFNKSSGF